MPLKTSISGIRGTIGSEIELINGKKILNNQNNLSPLTILRYAAAYFTWIIQKKTNKKPIVIIGRDGRISGAMVQDLVLNTGLAMGVDMIDIGLSTTPTVEMSVLFNEAAGGIMISASHNNKEWNALKLLNQLGEFIKEEDFNFIEQLYQQENYQYHFVNAQDLGKRTFQTDAIEKHIQAIISLPLVNIEAIKSANFKIVVDVINSTGAIAVPLILKALGVKNFQLIHQEITGDFAHNPEPLPENLISLQKAVLDNTADLGIAVDPDVDRLCFVCDNGDFFGEEYSLVAIADYYLQNKKGVCVSNLSSSKALSEIAAKYQAPYYASKVGEINVVNTMKEFKAIIGGEGSGGIIVPELHYGRDALVGIALFLSHLAKSKLKTQTLRSQYPNYPMKKDKIDLSSTNKNISILLQDLCTIFKDETIDKTEGLKIIFPEGWVHLRESNTEPIIRIYAEANTQQRLEEYITSVKNNINL